LKKNVGDVDALLRITIGLTGLAWGVAKMARDEEPGFGPILTFLSALKVAEGVVRICPMSKLLGISSTEDQLHRVERQGLFRGKGQEDDTRQPYFEV
jgi:hypothetical protein